jgi:site-specific DNA-methyltransferase (cytosine-N4-specific)
MIEQWDDLFRELDPEIDAALTDGDGRTAFERMHDLLADAWAEIQRVLVDGGIACINVGDATRTVAGQFRMYPNHARITEHVTELGFHQLPGVLWRKPTNSPTKFMGSGTLPPNAYVTLEHEHVLVFRNGGKRSFDPGAERRYGASYFWEERNQWFSDLWEDLDAAPQIASESTPRDRRAAFPVELPFRLISMYSVYGDTVLDPFWGTGTTTLAAMASARNSVGIEAKPGLPERFGSRVADVVEWSRERARRRLTEHREFVAERDESTEYDAQHYDFGVVSKQERQVRVYTVEDVEHVSGGYHVTHEYVDDADELVE